MVDYIGNEWPIPDENYQDLLNMELLQINTNKLMIGSKKTKIDILFNDGIIGQNDKKVSKINFYNTLNENIETGFSLIPIRLEMRELLQTLNTKLKDGFLTIMVYHKITRKGSYYVSAIIAKMNSETYVLGKNKIGQVFPISFIEFITLQDLEDQIYLFGKKSQTQTVNCTSKTKLDNYFDSCDSEQYDRYNQEFTEEKNDNCIRELNSMKETCEKVLSIGDREAIINFRQTYDTSYIKNFSNEQKNSLKQELNNPVLSKLIENSQENKLDEYDVSLIEGPLSFYKYELKEEGKLKKTFYLFGEYHRDTRGQCNKNFGDNRYYEFHDYLKKLSEHSPYFFDFYGELAMFGKGSEYIMDNHFRYFKEHIFDIIELMNEKRISLQESFVLFYKNKQVEISSYILNEITNTFKTCIQPATRNIKECSLMRIHNIDIRQNWNKSIDNLTYDFYLFIVFATIGVSEFDFSDKIQIFNLIRIEVGGRNISMILFLLSILNRGKNITKNLMEIFKTNVFYKKEIEKSEHSASIQAFIEQKIKKKVAKNYNNEEDIYDFIKNLFEIIQNPSKEITDPNINSKLIKFSQFLNSKIYILFMDAYCLARIFKKYYKENEPRFQPKMSNNIIVYTGDAHTKTYVQYLNSINAELIFSYRSEDSCVKINELKTEE